MLDMQDFGPSCSRLCATSIDTCHKKETFVIGVQSQGPDGDLCFRGCPEHGTPVLGWVLESCLGHECGPGQNHHFGQNSQNTLQSFQELI